MRPPGRRRGGPLRLPGPCLSVPLLLAAGCWSGAPAEKPVPPAKELTKASSRSVDTPEAAVLATAKKHYASSLPTIARGHFESLRDTYPSGPYGEFARIKIADTYFDAREYQAAAAHYEEFTKSFPTSPSLPYALLRAGRSLRLSSRGAGRDVAPVERSMEFYDRLVSRFPDSPYAGAAKTLRAEAAAVVASHEGFVRDFYEARSEERAAAARDASYRTKLAALEEKRRGPSSESPDVRASATIRAARPLVFSAVRVAPGRPPAAGTRAAGTRAGGTRALGGRAGDGPAAGSAGAAPGNAPADPAVVTVRETRCSATGGTRKVYFFLGRPVDEERYPSAVSRRLAADGSVWIRLPSASAKPGTSDCFGRGDLTVTADGTAVVRGLPPGSVRSAEVLSLAEPPRLLVTLDG